MKLYHNSEPIQSVFKAIGEANEYLVKENVSQFTEPNFNGIDSLRFVITKAFFDKFIEHFDLKFNETAFNARRHYTLADIYSTQTPKTAFICKVTDKIKIYAYHSTDTLNLSRKHKKKLDNFIFLEIHGLQQYQSEAAEPIKHGKKTRQILKYLLRYCYTQKSRNNITLKSFDFALDYFEKAKICKEYAIKKAEYLENLECEFKKYKDTTTLYIQKNARANAEPINANLQRVKIYDKTAKNSLKRPIIRFELSFFISDNG
ncbi:MAG: hypothetical protein IJP87_07465 [Campylobacter sp.]|nr:hypothetical protein [Campylobacter sp.]